jgi:glucose/arabinose dehydrogenase
VAWFPQSTSRRPRGWPADTTPHAAPGTKVVAFARGLDYPRWLHVLPSGDVLVAATRPAASRQSSCASPTAGRAGRRGALLVADDVGNVVWRVTASVVR